MAEQQIHRGPDSEGYYMDESFGFGIRRLSVIDLATGDQPISNESKQIWVVCNGEIYNYLEISASLKRKGHIFYSNSDTECIVHLYEEYGIDCLKFLNGMFGLAIYDKTKKRLFIARDRLGIKPLYYSIQSGYLLFSSEMRGILATDLVEKELDWNALSIFLDTLFIPTPYTPFRRISKLKPGHYLSIDNNGFSMKTPFWKLEDPPSEPLPRSEKEAVEMLTFPLKDSNRLQLRADVPLCVFLSGGIDSSAVAAFASMMSSFPLKTYHVYFKNAHQKMDERKYAKSVASMYGTIHSEVAIDRKDFVRLIPKLIWHLEEPFGDLASVPTYIISEMARHEVTVCLNGSGGDELFAGYPYHIDKSLIRRTLSSGLNKLGIMGRIESIISRKEGFPGWSSLFPNYMKRSMQIPPEDKIKTFRDRDYLNRILARDIDGYLQSNVLFLLDKITMAVSLEGRVPLLDHRFVEMASHLPSRWKIRKGERKYIFKKVLEPYLPHDVLYRDKEGFGAPLDEWLDESTRRLLCRIIENGMLRKNDLLFISNGVLKEMGAWNLWKMACMELWFQIFVDSGESSGMVDLESYG